MILLEKRLKKFKNNQHQLHTLFSVRSSQIIHIFFITLLLHVCTFFDLQIRDCLRNARKKKDGKGVPADTSLIRPVPLTATSM